VSRVSRVAAIDCGTNSIRLLIADIDSDAGTLVDLDRRMLVVRLGQGVDRTGRIAPEALRRTLDAAGEYAAACTAAGVERVRFIATSATRDASNRDEFAAGVRELLGVEPEIVSGHEEAALAFAGATRELPEAAAPFLVVDIGGGSTELVLGERSVLAAHSVDVGCVRLTERHLHTDPPTGAEVAAATLDADAALEEVASAVPLGRCRTLIGVAGSVTTVTAHALELPGYDSAAIHRAELPVESARAACHELLTMPRADRAALPYMHPGRVDVIGAGALIWRRVIDHVVEATGGSVTRVLTSEHDILDGIAWSIP
jgi:exopolyphosphatase/guanosine-5'-triphosphate,3'-diphosphate pyrophosphatase